MTRLRLGILGIAMSMVCAPSRGQTIIDVTTTGATGTGTAAIGGDFRVSQAFIGGAGSGAIHSFLRVQNDGGEQSYNTSAGKPFDGKNIPGGLDSLFLSDVPIVAISGALYREFVLDINQSGNGNISLNQLQIFQSSADPGTGGTATSASASADPVLSLSGGSLAEVFRLNNATKSASSFEILGNSGTGSGSIDVAFYVPNSAFAQTPGSFLTLFSQFGSPNGSLAANAGFEEWAVRAGVAAVPEPGSIALTGVVLGIFGMSTLLRRIRSRKAAAAR